VGRPCKHLRRMVVAVLIAAAWPASALCAPQQRYEYSQGQWVVRAAAEPEGPEAQVERVRSLVERGHNRQAAKQVKRFLKAHPDTPLREEAMNLAGAAMMNRGLYYQAFEWFEKQIGEFPNGPLLDRALDREYRIGDAFLKGKKRIAMGIFYLPAHEEGLEILQRIAEHAPGTALAEQALLRMADYHRDNRQWEEAVIANDAYVQMFPDRPASPAAMLGAAQATHRTYRGRWWDETPLIEARQRYREYALVYPVRGREQDVQGKLDQITDQRAQKAFAIADYYRRVRRAAAAAYYYRQAQEYFPGTPWAQQASQQLSSLRIPPLAPGRYGWQEQAPTPPAEEATRRLERPPGERPSRRKAAAEQMDVYRGTLEGDFRESR